MSVDKNPSSDVKSLRRSKRPLMRIPIEVAGHDADGKPFTESTFTLVVSRNGARIALKHSLQPGERIIITNSQREESCPFRVVGRTEDTYSDHTDWGVECLEPNRNFWGVYIPEMTSSAAQGEGIDVLVECGECHSREMAQLSMNQYRKLSTDSALARRCETCGKETNWEFGFAEVLTIDARDATPSGGEASSVEDRRATRRFVAMLPLQIRDMKGQEHTTRTENLSKMGLCFVSNVELQEGAEIFLAVGPARDNKKELPARIAWRRPIAGSKRALYGVRLQESENS